MARIHPSDIERLRAERSHRAELHTLDALHHLLSDRYTVFHSLHFAHLDGRRQRFGERQLHKQYTEGRKDVLAQFLRGRDRVLEQLGPIVSDLRRTLCMCCSDHSLRNGDSGLPRTSIVDARERSGLEASIARMLGPESEAHAETAERRSSGSDPLRE